LPVASGKPCCDALPGVSIDPITVPININGDKSAAYDAMEDLTPRAIKA
jgi:hypothetical protein